MKRALSFLVVALMALPSFAPANESTNLREWCEEKLQTQDQNERRAMGLVLMEQRLILGGEDVAIAEDCVKSLTGEDYIYDAGKMGFISRYEFEAKEAIKEAAEQEDANRKDDENQKRKDTLALIEKIESERKRKIQMALGEACDRLFSKSPDEAVLNVLCYERFLANGLPD